MKQGTKTVGQKSLALVLALVLALSVLAFSNATPEQAFAAENTEVNAVRDGVYAITVYYHYDVKRPDRPQDEPIQAGSCFFINRYELITANHVVTVDDRWDEPLANHFEDPDWRSSLVIKVTLMRDLETPVSLINASALTDFAILKVDDEAHIGEHAILTLADSDAVKQTESVYAIGFPAINRTDIGVMEDSQGIASLTAADTTVEDGAVTRITTASNGTNFIQHSATLSDGNSGGPLVNDKGQTIGVNNAVAFELFGTARANYSIASNQVKLALQKLNIQFTSSEEASSPIIQSGGSAAGTAEEEAEEEAEPVEKGELNAKIASVKGLVLSNYTDESTAALNSALSSAETVAADPNATQESVNSATTKLIEAERGLVEKPTLPLALIIGIAIAAVVVIAAVIILIIVFRNKKKKAQTAGALGAPPLPTQFPAPPAQAPVAPPGSSPPIQAVPAALPGVVPVQPAAPAVAPVYQPPQEGFDPQGSGDTTVLNPTVGETSILAGGSTPARLLRVSNNERMRIDRPNFIIGKERKRVAFVIPDNSAISRTHAKITVTDGQYYITDLNTTNFTFVNDKKIPPNQEVPINAGDKIRLADEEFVFEA